MTTPIDRRFPRQRIVTDVLDWSKLDAGSITPEVISFDLRVVVENALETVSHLARSKNISLLLENPVSTDPPMPLLGDPHRYRQCLLNLLSNAISESAWILKLNPSHLLATSQSSPNHPSTANVQQSVSHGHGESL